MKQNPQTKIELGDDSPVMNCRAIRCRKMNGSDDSKAWGVGATLVPKEKLGMEEMGAMTQQETGNFLQRIDSGITTSGLPFGNSSP